MAALWATRAAASYTTPWDTIIRLCSDAFRKAQPWHICRFGDNAAISPHQ
jgi:hypothetical protein